MNYDAVDLFIVTCVGIAVSAAYVLGKYMGMRETAQMQRQALECQRDAKEKIEWARATVKEFAGLRSLTNWDGYEHLKPEEKVGYLRARAAELARRNR